MTYNKSNTYIGTTIASPITIEYEILSPYFLCHSDNPDIVLVSQVLMGDNYPTLSKAIHMAFKAKYKLGSINGTLPKLIVASIYFL